MRISDWSSDVCSSDLRNIFALSRGQVRNIPIDGEGLRLGPWLDGLRYLVVTPAHQCPTMVTMPNERRQALLDWAAAADAVLLEVDYEGETRFEASLPALKPKDRDGRPEERRGGKGCVSTCRFRWWPYH